MRLKLLLRKIGDDLAVAQSSRLLNVCKLYLLLIKGRSADKNVLIDSLKGNLVSLSKDKYASNVIEKCLRCGTERQFEEYGAELFRSNKLVALMTDKYANFVVQTVLELAKGECRSLWVQRVQEHEATLKKSVLGKYVLKTLA